MFLSQSRKWLSRAFHGTKRPPQYYSVRPVVEQLEDRLVFTVNPVTPRTYLCWSTVGRLWSAQ
jgi:hypothetical protein